MSASLIRSLAERVGICYGSGMRDELSAWERSREATRQILREIGCDEKGYPLPEKEPK